MKNTLFILLVALPCYGQIKISPWTTTANSNTARVALNAVENPTNSATATDGQVLSKTGNKTSFVTASGGSGDSFWVTNAVGVGMISNKYSGSVFVKRGITAGGLTDPGTGNIVATNNISATNNLFIGNAATIVGNLGVGGISTFAANGQPTTFSAEGSALFVGGSIGMNLDGSLFSSAFSAAGDIQAGGGLNVAGGNFVVDSDGIVTVNGGSVQLVNDGTIYWAGGGGTLQSDGGLCTLHSCLSSAGGASFVDGLILIDGSGIATTSNIEFTDDTKGVILKDTTNGDRYRLKVTAGVLLLDGPL